MLWVDKPCSWNSDCRCLRWDWKMLCKMLVGRALTFWSSTVKAVPGGLGKLKLPRDELRGRGVSLNVWDNSYYLLLKRLHYFVRVMVCYLLIHSPYPYMLYDMYNSGQLCLIFRRLRALCEDLLHTKDCAQAHVFHRLRMAFVTTDTTASSCCGGVALWLLSATMLATQATEWQL